MSSIILVISDNSSFASFLCELLNDKGQTATSCAHGETALKLIRTGRPDLVIAEVLPEFLGSAYGQKFSTTLAFEGIPLVAVTDASLLEEELLDALDVIPKPVDYRRLLENVHRLANPSRHNILLPPLNDPDCRLLCNHLLSRTGLHFDRRNRSSLERGVAKRMTALMMGNHREYLEFLKRHGEDRRELQKLLRYLTIGETHFFRYRAQFEALRAQLSEHRGGPLRFWSAGCSTGEEPYSIAITVIEAVPNWRERDIVIYATDINNHSLRRAREGVYTSWALRNLEPAYLERYFVKVGESYLVGPELKRLVRFSHLNLSDLDYPAASGGDLSDLDAIFCRNVMIYFTREQAQQMVESFASSLRGGGCLYLGHAETLLHNSPSFVSEGRAGCFYYRKPVQPMAESPKAPPRVPRPAPPQAPPAPPVSSLEQARARFDAEDFDAALEFLARPVAPSDEPAALVLKGFILAGRGELREALTLCDRAIAANDLLAEAYFLRGVILDAGGQVDRAGDQYRKALLLDDGFIMPRYYRARLLLQTGKREEAVREIRNSIRKLDRYGDLDTIPYSGGMTRAVCKMELQKTLAKVSQP